MNNLPADKIISCFYGSSDDCVKVVSTDGMLMSLNPHGLTIMEIDSQEDVLGQDWVSLWKDGMHEKAADAVRQANNGHLAKFEGYCPTFKGNMRYWEVSVAPLFDDYAGVQWLLVTSRDVTKYKDLEKKVSEQENQIAELRHRVSLYDEKNPSA